MFVAHPCVFLSPLLPVFREQWQGQDTHTPASLRLQRAVAQQPFYFHHQSWPGNQVQSSGVTLIYSWQTTFVTVFLLSTKLQRKATFGFLLCQQLLVFSFYLKENSDHQLIKVSYFSAINYCDDGLIQMMKFCNIF